MKRSTKTGARVRVGPFEWTWTDARYDEGVRQGRARERARLRRLFVVAMRGGARKAETPPANAMEEIAARARVAVVADLIAGIRCAKPRRRR